MRTTHPTPESVIEFTAPSPTEGLFTVGEIARKLKVSISDIRGYVRSGGHVYRDGRKVRLSVEDVEPWLDNLAKMRRLYSEAMVWMETA